MSAVNITRVRNHLLLWIAYISFKAFLNITNDNELIAPEAIRWENILTAFSVQISFLIIKIPLVYGSLYLINVYLNDQKKRIFIASSIALLIFIAAMLMSLLNHIFVLPVLYGYHGPSGSIFSFNSTLYHYFTLLFICGIACAIWLLERQNRIQVQTIALQKEKTEAELNYLKAQINPHFLFNTLNNIYSLARKGSPQTADAVMKLSNLMRFMLFEARQNTILLKDELQLIRDYIELEQLRYTNRLEIVYEEDIDNPAQRIAPLLIIHFVENAFKHGASESRFDARIRISISLKQGLLQAKIKNTKSTLTEVPSHHLGLENIKRQLQLIYPLHQISVENLAEEFKVHLTINLI